MDADVTAYYLRPSARQLLTPTETLRVSAAGGFPSRSTDSPTHCLVYLRLIHPKSKI
ncbi:hypothetical protein [Mastigocladopsis repens]|uniref:hypothetical protein n=1 Tax=Mastigocladopsis repens TaxID=221287 RepID=UPI00031365E7|nr:hypothetical protein [Mastigocladopsis repens]